MSKTKEVKHQKVQMIQLDNWPGSDYTTQIIKRPEDDWERKQHGRDITIRIGVGGVGIQLEECHIQHIVREIERLKELTKPVEPVVGQ